MICVQCTLIIQLFFNSLWIISRILKSVVKYVEIEESNISIGYEACYYMEPPRTIKYAFES